MNLIGENNLTAEESVLGAVFLDPNVLDEITFLEDRDFLAVRHQSIYKVFRYLEKKANQLISLLLQMLLLNLVALKI